MGSTRQHRFLALAMAVGLVAACGSSSGTPAASAGGGGGTTGGASAPAAQPSQANPDAGGGPSADTGGPSAATGGGTTTGVGGDTEAVAKQLVPPNSHEVTRTAAEGTFFAMYQSTDSPDTLKSFYESTIPKTGLQIISTTSSNGGYSWIIANDANGSFGGAVSVFPAGDGSTGVQVTIGHTS